MARGVAVPVVGDSVAYPATALGVTCPSPTKEKGTPLLTQRKRRDNCDITTANHYTYLISFINSISRAARSRVACAGRFMRTGSTDTSRACIVTANTSRMLRSKR